MGTTYQTEEFYSRQESVGVAVSPFTNIPSPAPAHHAPPAFRPTGACWLRCALVHLRLGHVRDSWSVYLSTVNRGLEPD